MAQEDTHDHVAVVKLDGYDATGSKGGVVEAVDWIIKEENIPGRDENGDPLWSPRVKNWKDNPDTYKIITLASDSDVQIGWILDAETGTTLRNPNT